jgi:hypothetical protein
VLDLSEHRFDDRLPPSIDFPPQDRLQFSLHTFQGRGRLGIGPRGQGGTIWLCFCLPVAT